MTTTGYSLAAAPPDRTKTLTFVIIGLLISAPFIGWKLWRPRPASAGGRPGSGRRGGIPGQPDVNGPAGSARHGAMAGSQWMNAPPPHQVVVDPEADRESGADAGARNAGAAHEPDET